MKKLLIFSFLLALAALAPAQKLTLTESLETGLKNSKDLKISRSKLSSSEAKITEAASQLLPQLKFQAGYTRLSDVPPFEVQLPISPKPIRLAETILNNYQLRLSLQQPLFTGFRLTSLKKASEISNEAARRELGRETNDAALKIRTAFWQYHKAGLLLAVITENLKLAEKRLEDTKNFFTGGLATQNDVLKLQVQSSNVRLQLIEAQNNLDLARMAFNQAVGLDINALTEIDPPAIDAKPAAMKQAELIAESRDNRSEIKALESKLEQSGEMVNAAKSGWLPQIYLNANAYYNRPNQRYQPALDKFKDTWDVGVALSWDVWNWGYTSSQTLQAEESRLQTETGLAQLMEAVELEVYQGSYTAARAYEKVEVSRAAVGQAKENYRITDEKYAAQLATSTEIADASASLLSAETNYASALVDYELAKLRLEKALGRKLY